MVRTGSAGFRTTAKEVDVVYFVIKPTPQGSSAYSNSIISVRAWVPRKRWGLKKIPEGMRIPALIERETEKSILVSPVSPEKVPVWVPKSQIASIKRIQDTKLSDFEESDTVVV